MKFQNISRFRRKGSFNIYMIVDQCSILFNITNYSNIQNVIIDFTALQIINK